MNRRGFVVLACSLLLGTSWSSPSSAADVSSRLAQILANMRNIEAFSAHFREEKRIALLSVPLSSEGDIHYMRPGRLIRRTRKPEAALLAIDARMLRFQDASGSHSMTLAENPAVNALTSTLMQVLSGDRQALEAGATLTEEPVAGEQFRLRVVPKAPAVQKLVRVMTFEGVATSLTRMTLVDGNGDETVTEFSDVRTRKPYTDIEWAKLEKLGD